MSFYLSFSLITGFTTPLDEEECPDYVDEYILFQDVMQSEFIFIDINRLLMKRVHVVAK